MAAEYADALGRTITYIDVPLERWRDQELRHRKLPDHVFEHLLTMVRLHAANRYDRLWHADLEERDRHDHVASSARARDHCPRAVWNEPEQFRPGGDPRQRALGIGALRKSCRSAMFGQSFAHERDQHQELWAHPR